MFTFNVHTKLFKPYPAIFQNIAFSDALLHITNIVKDSVIESSQPSKELMKKYPEINCLFCENDEIQVLNRNFRFKNKPTDVLAFEMKENEILGDIAISLETALVQSLEHNISFQAEISRLLIHGFLHLLGYDHEEDDDEKIMTALEKKTYAKVENKIV